MEHEAYEIENENTEVTPKQELLNSLYQRANQAIENGEFVLIKRLTETISKIEQIPNVEKQKSPTEIMRERRAKRDELMAELERRFELINSGSETK